MTAALLETNLQALRSIHPRAAQLLQTHAVDRKRYVVAPTKDDYITVLCHTMNGDRPVCSYLHSRYSPISEALRFAEHQYSDRDITLFGFGLGYHVQALFDKLTEGQHLHVLAANLDTLRLAFEFFSFEALLNSDQFLLDICDSPEACTAAVEKASREHRSVVIHRPSLQGLNDTYAELKVQLLTRVMPPSDDQRREYARINHFNNMQRNARLVSELWGRHQGAIAIIVSSGPSLERYADWLQTLPQRANIILLCAGSALRFLRARGILPSYVVLMDALPTVSQQFEGVDAGDAPLLFANFSSHEAVQLYRPKKYLYYCEAFAGISSDDVLSVGDSVAHAAFSAAIRMGAQMIVFIGQDLCFLDGKHHVPGALGEMTMTMTGPEPANLKRVRNVQGKYVSTQPNWISYRSWFEDAIAANADVSFYNLTEEGLPISGAPCISPEELTQIITGLT
ncbi:MAG: motility associated factor glycosyltransferase family protein [Deltaproteobacteria bacterium]|nr:motility associated factor glycosyltransferase family protein [Deltaproteobacteria bacterium]MBN2673298.1 motility associated factor glycosyltransferase family protein [Deltaproteobacteria bacterium]